MFLQETKTKRGGKTYISYLVRESFRTANGPRGRTICNLTHLPKEVRDMVGHALRGEALVPLERLQVNNIHSFGGCVVLEDAARRHHLAEVLSPLGRRNASLIHALIFGGLLFPPSVAPFHVESRPVRLAMFCGLEPEEKFDFSDLAGALRELDEKWAQVCAILARPPHGEVRALTLFETGQSASRVEMAALGMDPEGIPTPLIPDGGEEGGLQGYLRHLAQRSKSGAPLLALDEEIGARMHVESLQDQPYLIDLTPESLAALLQQLNMGQLQHALRAGGPVEVRHHGERYILSLETGLSQMQEAQVRMGSLKELSTISTARHPEQAQSHSLPAANLEAVHTNVSAERLPAGTALEWARRARAARSAFAPVQIVMGRGPSGEGFLTWRNHTNLQFLTHRLRCHLQGEWKARGEARPVEEVLRDLQDLHRATLTVDGVVVRRLATNPSRALAALLTRLNLWDLFESADPQKKQA
ncbi:MAG TPA: hypothetical protein VHY22_11320 [Chthoniobacteraceae bacterium]|nr:hypothetical protein [Chthoniobacteraceae bacterium]